MFRKLQLQFILTNLTIIMLLLVSLTTGAYCLLDIKMVNHAEFFVKRMATGINSGIFPEAAYPLPRGPEFLPQREIPLDSIVSRQSVPPETAGGTPLGHDRPTAPVLFAKTDQMEKVVFMSTQCSGGTALLAKLVKRVGRHGKESGIVRVKGRKYFYYKTPQPKRRGMLLIFQDLKADQQNQHSLIIWLIGIGSVYLILALFGSILMARRAIGPIQKAWQQQKDFVADASHELRTPLAVIQTNLEVVQDNPQATVASQHEWLANIQEELQQMTVLVTSLLFLARVDSHQSVLDKKYFRLDKLLMRVCETFKPILSAQGLDLTTGLQQDLFCFGDESTMRQVVENLLDNAIRHTAAGGRITVKLEQTGKKIVLSVADTGEGIAPEHQAKIFDRFYQVDSSRSKGKTGLGLTIAKCIIENHGGSIQVSSQPGLGTTFSVQLPYVKELPVALTNSARGGLTKDDSFF